MIDCKAFYFEDDGLIPNNPSQPLLLYQAVLSEEQRHSDVCIELLSDHGWSNSWTNGIFPYHHYHSNAHEVLAMLNGAARVILGGEQGEVVTLNKGDVVLIPAGVGHCRLDSSIDFLVAGAYDRGLGYDLCRGRPGEQEEALENIKQVPLPQMDPVTGEEEPLYRYWNR